MISRRPARFVLAAAEKRLGELRQAPDPAGLGKAVDPEEALRRFMVNCLPLIPIRGNSVSWRKEVFDAVLSLGEAASGNDIRYLDAFNIFYERASDECWRSDGLWRSFTAAYAHLLSLLMKRLGSGQ